MMRIIVPDVAKEASFEEGTVNNVLTLQGTGDTRVSLM